MQEGKSLRSELGVASLESIAAAVTALDDHAGNEEAIARRARVLALVRVLVGGALQTGAKCLAEFPYRRLVGHAH